MPAKSLRDLEPLFLWNVSGQAVVMAATLVGS
jgi:hypothetical protein